MFDESPLLWLSVLFMCPLKADPPYEDEAIVMFEVAVVLAITL